MRSGDPIDLYECYMHADVDGDGIAEKVRVWWAGDPAGGKQVGQVSGILRLPVGIQRLRLYNPVSKKSKTVTVDVLPGKTKWYEFAL